MIFNGIDLSPYLRIKEIHGRGISPSELTLIDVPAMDGAYYSQKRRPSRVIEIEADIRASNREELRTKLDQLNAILDVDQPVPIVFPDEPDMIYYGIPESTGEGNEYTFLHQGQLTIICPDPYKYGDEVIVEFPSDTVIVENPGTAPSEPIFELTATKQTTFAMVTNGEQYMAIGRPEDAIDVPASDREVVLNDDASSLVGWSAYTSGSTLYNLGIVGGKMGVYNGFAFYAEEYGENPNGWVGPAIRRSLPEQLQDFMITIDIEMRNLGGGVGRIVLFGMDANDDLVFTMGMMDSTATYANNRALFGVGPNNYTWINYQGDNNRVVWNDARLQLRIQRKGQVYEGWIAEKLDPEGKRLTGRHWDSYHDTANQFQEPLAQIGIYIAKAKHYDTFPMRFHGLTAWELFNLEDYQIPYIAEEGDLITFDHVNREALINGYPVQFDFGGDFFELYRGDNSIVVLPENTFGTTLSFRPRYR